MKKFTSICVTLLLACLAWPCFSMEPIYQPLKPNEIKAALAKLKTMPNDTARVNLLIKIAYANLHDYEKFRYLGTEVYNYLNEANTISRQRNYTRGQLLSNIYIALWHNKRGDTTIAITKCKQAIQQCMKAKDDYARALALLTLGRVETADTVKISSFTNAAVLFKKAGYLPEQAYALRNLAYTLPAPADRVRLIMEAMKIYKKHQYSAYPYTLWDMSNMMGEQNRHTDALKYAFECYNVSRKIKDIETEMDALLKIGNCYLSLNEPKRAITHFKAGLNYFIGKSDTTYSYYFAYSLSQAYQSNNESEKAIKMYKNLVKRFPIKDKPRRLEIDYMLFYLYFFGLDVHNEEERKYYHKILNAIDSNTVSSDKLRVYYAAAWYNYARLKNMDSARYYLKKTEEQGAYTTGTETLAFAIDSTEGKYLSAIKHYQNF